MNKIVSLLIVVVSLALSCKKGSQTPDVYPMVQIRYLDSTGNDLFSPAHDGQNGYWMDSVRIYDYKNGIKTLIYQGPTANTSAADYPYGYVFTTYSNISDIPGEYMIIYPNEDVVNRYSNSIIQLKAGVFDTLRVHLTGNVPYGSQYDSVWYNSLFEPNGKSAGFINIVK